MGEALLIANAQMVDTGRRMAALFEQRVQPGMVPDDVVRTVIQISVETNGFNNDGQPTQRQFRFEGSQRVDIWEYNLDGSFAQNDDRLVYFLTFRDGRLVEMRTKA